MGRRFEFADDEENSDCWCSIFDDDKNNKMAMAPVAAQIIGTLEVFLGLLLPAFRCFEGDSIAGAVSGALVFRERSMVDAKFLK